MTDGNPLQNAAAIKRYLDEFDRTTAGRGAHYFKYNSVLQLRCDEPGKRYSATVRAIPFTAPVKQRDLVVQAAAHRRGVTLARFIAPQLEH